MIDSDDEDEDEEAAAAAPALEADVEAAKEDSPATANGADTPMADSDDE